MPTAKKTTTAKKAGSRSTGKKTAQTKKTPAKRKPDKRVIAKKKQFFSAEVKIIVTALAALFLFFSNFGVMGAAGAFFSDIERGLFGMVGYAFPVLLILAVGLYVKNQGTFLAEAKLVCSLLMILILSALMQLLFGSAETAAPAHYYVLGTEGALGGGAVGGVIAGFLRSFSGTIGAYLILIALLIICMVFVTERSFVNAAKSGAERTAKAAAEGHERAREAAAAYRERKEERREEERLRREERTARGINFDALSLAEEKAASKELSDKAAMYADYGRELIGGQPGVDDVDDGTGHGALRFAKHSSGDTVDGAHDSRYDTQILPDPSVFRGKIEGVPDPDDDTVPFDETEESPYKSYRFDNYDNPAQASDSVFDLAQAERSGYAAGSGTEQNDYLKKKEDTYNAGFEKSDSSFGETDEIIDENGGEETLGSIEGYAGDETVGNAAEYGREGAVGSAEKYGGEEAVGSAANYGSGYTVTATGKVLSGTAPEAAELLQKKLRGEIDRIDTGDEQKSAWEKMPGETGELSGTGKLREAGELSGTGRTGEPGRAERQDGPEELSEGSVRRGSASQTAEKKSNAPTDAENKAVAAEIEKKTVVKKPYEFPPLNLLKRGPRTAYASQQELKETAVKLQQTLRTFGVGVTVTNVSMGPAVTRYELQPDVGVKVSRITSLTDDIKLALAAADIRIEAPVPGKAAVGIEVPNKSRATVYFRDIIDTDEFRNHPSHLAFGIGRDIAGKIVIGDIAKMPHLLIAGATGSGKSVSINTLIMSLIYKSSPEDVRMIMIDPKVVELSVYNGIPHLLIPVVTEPKKAASALNWAVAEMTDRYKKFSEVGVRDLKGYNQKAEEVRKRLSAETDEEKLPKKMPQIVIIIDELADLMMVASNEVETSIARLTQLARAAGLHLVIATQRPTVNVITGLIKANVPCRIAFQTSSSIDSRTILDMNGAEKLLGSGDMLYNHPGASKPIRVQGSFVSDNEVKAVVDFLTQKGDAEYSEEIGNAITQQSLELSEPGGGAKSARDEYFADAARLIIEKNKASIGMLQRMFQIGFNRAARVMDQLAEAGVVGPEKGTKPREILMNAEEFEQFINQ